MSITGWIEDELGFDVDATDISLDSFQTVERALRYCQSNWTSRAEKSLRLRNPQAAAVIDMSSEDSPTIITRLLEESG